MDQPGRGLLVGVYSPGPLQDLSRLGWDYPGVRTRGEHRRIALTTQYGPNPSNVPVLDGPDPSRPLESQSLVALDLDRVHPSVRPTWSNGSTKKAVN